MQAYASIPTQKMLYTSLPLADESGVMLPMDEIKNLKFPIAPHSERKAFIGAGYWFFWMNPATLSRLPVKFVEHKAKYASRTISVTFVTYF